MIPSIRDDKNNNKHTYINANAISSSTSSISNSISSSVSNSSSSNSIKSISDDSQRASTLAASSSSNNKIPTTINKVLLNFSSPEVPKAIPPTTPIKIDQQQPYNYKKSFLMQKYKFHRVINEEDKSVNKNTGSSSSSSNRSSTAVSDGDGNGGDGNHHDLKDDTINNDKVSDATEIRQHQHEDDQLKTDNVKTGDESTNTLTASSSTHSIKDTTIKCSPEQQQQLFKEEEKTNSIGEAIIRQQRKTRLRLPYKKFVETSTPLASSSSNSKYRLIRKRSISREENSSFSVKRTTRSSSISSPLKRSKITSFIANSRTTTNTNRKPFHQDPAKYKYVKKPQGN